MSVFSDDNVLDKDDAEEFAGVTQAGGNLSILRRGFWRTGRVVVGNDHGSGVVLKRRREDVARMDD